MSGFNKVLPWVLGGVAGGVLGNRPKQPKLIPPDFSTILTSAPTGTASSDLAIAKKRTAARLRSDVALTKPRATILTGSQGVAPAGDLGPRKTTIGGGY